jgi:hypothetical protein
MTRQSTQMTTERLLRDRSFGFEISEHHIAWTVERLCEGLDSESLRILAGLHPVRECDEVEPCFLKTCAELGIELPPPADPLRKEACKVRHRYDTRSVSAGGAIRMMFHLCSEANYGDPSLKVWFYIDEEIAHLGSQYGGHYYPPKLLGSLDETFIREWDLYRRTVMIGPPVDFLNYGYCDRCGHAGRPVLRKGPASGGIWHMLSWFQRSTRAPSCSQCGSFDCHDTIDPFVRDRYLKSLEDEECEAGL